MVSKRAGAYKSEKRKKELMRLKKQQEKRTGRTGGLAGTSGSEALGESVSTEPRPMPADEAGEPEKQN